MDVSHPASLGGQADVNIVKLDVSTQEYADLKGNMHSDREEEQALTLHQAIKDHPALVWWSFYWAMAAVGWYAPLHGYA